MADDHTTFANLIWQVLKERRSAINTAAVTRKIDVMGSPHES